MNNFTFSSTISINYGVVAAAVKISNVILIKEEQNKQIWAKNLYCYQYNWLQIT